MGSLFDSLEGFCWIVGWLFSGLEQSLWMIGCAWCWNLVDQWSVDQDS